MFVLYEGSQKTGYENESVEGLLGDIENGRRDEAYLFDGLGVAVKLFNKSQWDEELEDPFSNEVPGSIHDGEYVLEFGFSDAFVYKNIAALEIELINNFFVKELPDRGFHIAEE